MMDTKPQTIEQTSKRWKVAVLVSVAIMVFGIVVGVAGAVIPGTVFFVIGFIVAIAARFGSWWENG